MPVIMYVKSPRQHSLLEHSRAHLYTHNRSVNAKANDTMSTAVVSLGVNTPYEIREICFDANNPSLMSSAAGYESVFCGDPSVIYAHWLCHAGRLGRASSTARRVLQAAYHFRIAP